MVIADSLAGIVDQIFQNYQEHNGVTLIIGAIAFSFQIYGDFSGYSDIALGTAKLFGFELLSNFKFPYFSRDLAEFWRRWHISLSTWLRDYLYIPLGGNKVSPSRVYLNLILVMALGGMWHGAAWSYALWGLYHGFGLALERLLGLGDFNGKGRWVLNMRRLLVFSFVTLGWTFFKFTDANQAFDFLRLSLVHWKEMPELKRVVPILVYCLPIALYYWHASHMIRTKGDQGSTWIGRKKQWVLGVMLFLVFVNRGQSGEFIYFQF
jgi:alginate O-acetyltransferase complex protein AlgI